MKVNGSAMNFCNNSSIKEYCQGYIVTRIRLCRTDSSSVHQYYKNNIIGLRLTLDKMRSEYVKIS